MWTNLEMITLSDVHLFKDISVRLGADGSAQEIPLQWRHNGRGSVSNHQPHDGMMSENICKLHFAFYSRQIRSMGLCKKDETPLLSYCSCVMMTSSNGNIFRVTGHLCGEFTGPGEFPAQRPVTRSFDVFFICVWINGWINNREAGDFRRYRAHYDVIVKVFLVLTHRDDCLQRESVVTWLALQAPIPCFHMILTRSSLFLQMSWHLRVPGHQQRTDGIIKIRLQILCNLIRSKHGTPYSRL